MLKVLTKSDTKETSLLKQERASIMKEEASLVEMDVMMRWEMSKIEREKASVSEAQYALMLQDMERLRTEWQHRSEDLHYRKEMYAVQTTGISAVSFVEDNTSEEQSRTSKMSKILEFVEGEMAETGILFATFTFGVVACVVTPIVWGINLFF